MGALDDFPVRLVNVVAEEDSDTVTLHFEGERVGGFEHAWDWQVDRATAERIQRYCEQQTARGQPVYREIIEQFFGPVQNN
jgi:hypothetical protein